MRATTRLAHTVPQRSRVWCWAGHQHGKGTGQCHGSEFSQRLLTRTVTVGGPPCPEDGSSLSTNCREAKVRWGCCRPVLSGCSTTTVTSPACTTASALHSTQSMTHMHTHVCVPYSTQGTASLYENWLYFYKIWSMQRLLATCQSQRLALHVQAEHIWPSLTHAAMFLILSPGVQMPGIPHGHFMAQVSPGASSDCVVWHKHINIEVLLQAKQ